MTPKERITASLRGEPVDRIPWSPFLAYWWEAQSRERIRGGQLKYLESVGADPILRGAGAAWRAEYKDMRQSSTVKGASRYDVIETPVGKLTMGYMYSSAGDTWFLVEHPIHTAEELKILQWIYEHIELKPSKEADDMVKAVGERGLVWPILGTEFKTCFQSLVEKWIGTVNLTYFLMDAPQKVEECLAVMRSVSDRTVDLSAECSAEGFIFWEDSSTTNISPNMFEKYAAPEIAAWGDKLHRNGKMLIHHACGHIAKLLPLMGRQPIDAIESISPPPTGDIDIADAFERIPANVALVGGIEPVFFQNCSEARLKERVEELKRAAAGRRYVLANSDSCPPAVDESKFSLVSALLRKGI